MPALQPLLPQDPTELGGHTLLGRLGAGGMGVVYLGRSPGGSLSALKVVRAEHARLPGFLARFRREAEATRRVSSRWLVPVTAADTGAPQPWLATAFVPGLSLTEAVDGHGPLPERTVRILGARLAEALTAVHTAGLVHRDVKPGNILLALDGPRLIDFGIVRPDGVTALTESGLVIGSPGFLPPEQAQARTGEVGPPGDVFSLGCALAYAASGRRPFDAATVAGALYRTVHELADLTGVPAGLLPLLRACLAKAPGDRPAAAAVLAALRGEAEGNGPEGNGPEGVGGTGRDDAGTRAGSWLPAPLLARIAERSTEALALPAPTRPAPAATRPTPPPDGNPTTPRQGNPTAPLHGNQAPPPHGNEAPPDTVSASRRPSRRLLLGLGAATVLGGAAAALAVTLPGGDGTGGDPARPVFAIGLQADLSGELRALGRAQERGARLALAHANADPDRAFDLELRVQDDHGQATRAGQAAAALAADPKVLAVLGPTGRAGLTGVLDRCERALLPLVTVSCDDERYTQTTYRTFFRLRPSRTALAVGFRDYLSTVEPAGRITLVDDRAATGDDGWGLVESLLEAPPPGGRITRRPGPDGEDFTPLAKEAVASGEQAVIYVGTSPHRAAGCARALHDAGFDGVRMAAEPVLRPELPAGGGPARLPFVREAGAAGDGWVCVTGYADPTRLPGAADFTAAYRRDFPGPPALGPTAPFAVEAYDAVLFLADTLRRSPPAGRDRGSLTGRLRSAEHRGLAKPLAFTDSGRFRWETGLYAFRLTHGAARYLGNIAEL